MLTRSGPRAGREEDPAPSQPQAGRDPIDEEIAVRLLGYRWVVWRKGSGLLPSEGEEGRFLVPPDFPLATVPVPPGSQVALAAQPLRYVPRFSTDVKAAFEVAHEMGLFSSGKVFLTVSVFGEWRVHDEGDRVIGVGSSLPEALCRAMLAWRDHRGRGAGSPRVV